ncbi:MAG: hypothetical protein AUJ85_07770 [Elusimicrobia bacterium CG1_02_37_114]|nr:MAG: hypothetical protein AUJ85_07770 [Elusimicrobia bacterium CG1_02_37_114]PIV53523.1 MAG: hypothetical protein COS17_03520 [Elusimicrobia bacterium CG02_land_8_20_14_3_00_37_13]PIZ13425.1 MAG: hypothetical protein COY53_04960 [Elusimicrobia bacterium CG_4_10_14_0_8_um_filter_37_32]
MSAVDLTFLKSYFGKWVALTRDQKRVIASGKTFKETIERVQKKKYKDPIYTKVIDFASFIP